MMLASFFGRPACYVTNTFAANLKPFYSTFVSVEMAEFQMTLSNEE
jgi:hypothetical protein